MQNVDNIVTDLYLDRIKQLIGEIELITRYKYPF